MKEQERYQTDSHHQHGRSQKPSGLCASPKSIAEAGCTAVAWQTAEPLLCSSKPIYVIQTPHTGKHEVEVIGRVIKECPYSLVCPGIGPISLSHTLRWRDKSTYLRTAAWEGWALSGASCLLGKKQFCRYPAKRSVEKGRCPTQGAMRGNCSFLRRRAQSESDICPTSCSQRWLNYSDCL